MNKDLSELIVFCERASISYVIDKSVYRVGTHDKPGLSVKLQDSDGVWQLYWVHQLNDLTDLIKSFK